MNSNLALLSLGVAMLVASGCSIVTTKHPLSSNPQPIDQEKFEGAWLVDDGVFHVMFASNGIAKTASVVWESNQFHIAHGEMVVAEGNEHNFMSVRFDEAGAWMDYCMCVGEDDYVFCQYTFTDQGDLLLWYPNIDAFEAAIETRHLKGVVKHEQHSTSITVTNAPGELLEFLNNPKNVGLFEYTEPKVLRKIASPEKAGAPTPDDKISSSPENLHSPILDAPGTNASDGT